ncbi:MAG: hypothetical protein AAFW60_07770 [Pseudomonadota bacterium]
MRIEYLSMLGIVSALGAPTVLAQAQTTVPCQDETFRQLDFWVGEWDATWENPDGSIGKGTNSITKDEYGDCVIIERFSGPGLNGLSVSTFHAPLGQWRQTWVDDQGGYFALVGGPSSEEDTEFALELTRMSDTAPYLRMIWQNVSDQSFVWRWQGKASEDADWQDSWVINYQRQKAE